MLALVCLTLICAFRFAEGIESSRNKRMSFTVVHPQLDERERLLQELQVIYLLSPSEEVERMIQAVKKDGVAALVAR